MDENKYSSKSCCVWDNGLFVELAIKLSESFGKVYYYSPWQSSFPKSNSLLVGSGLDEIERLNNVFDHIDDIDLFVFPDVYYGDIQRYLDSKGKRVWGGRHGDELELYRDSSKQYLEKNGILVSPYTTLTGTKALRDYLAEHENQWVKINLTRGDMETFHSKNGKNIEPRIQKLEHDLGAKKEIITFIVEDSIDDAVETGYDGYCIDGEFPKAGFCGIEMKDKGYVMVAHTEDGKIPEAIKNVNDKLSETLRKYQYRNFISTELRVTRNGDAYLIDPCMRCGSPPSELYMNVIKNLADVLWWGSAGVCIEPVIEHKYGAELIIHSQWADKEWQTIQFPPEIRDNLRFRNICKIGGEYYVVPQIVGLPEIGAVVATGDTMEEAIEKVKDYAAQVESYDLTTFPECLDTAQEEIDKLKEWGIDIESEGD